MSRLRTRCAPLFQFRFSDTRDRLLIIGGILAACAHGSMMPLMTIVFGDLTTTFINNDQFDQFWAQFGDEVSANCNNITKEEAQANYDEVL